MGLEATDNPPDHEMEDLGRRYRALLAAVQGPGLTADEAVWDKLTETQQALDAARAREQPQRQDAERPAREATGGALGTLLGPETTGLKVTTALRLQPIPTGIYHLLDPATHPLLTVTVQNESHEPRRVCVSAYLEGISARAIRTIELERMDKGQTIPLLPSLLPGPAPGSPRSSAPPCTSSSPSMARPATPGANSSSRTIPTASCCCRGTPASTR